MAKKKASFHEESKDPMVPPKSEEAAPAENQMDPMTMMSQMMSTFQNMMTGQGQMVSSQPFSQKEVVEPEQVTHDIILPSTIERGKVAQEGLDVHPFFSKLFMDGDDNPIRGLPRGTTITLTGPPYTAKTRSALEMIINAVQKGIKTAYVVAEEGFIDTKSSGRNDLFSRLLSMVEETTDMTIDEFREKYDDMYYIIPNQYHLGKTWAEFIKDYRYVVEKLECAFTIIDSINMLDPSKRSTVDNLNALKTYHHEQGTTCVVIGQIKDSGIPQGGEALYHTSEVAIHLYEHSLGSKDEAMKWGGTYREKLLMSSSRSKVCKSIDFPIKLSLKDGLIRADEDQPPNHLFPDGFWD